MLRAEPCRNRGMCLLTFPEHFNLVMFVTDRWGPSSFDGHTSAPCTSACHVTAVRETGDARVFQIPLTEDGRSRGTDTAALSVETVERVRLPAGYVFALTSSWKAIKAAGISEVLVP